MVYAWRIIHTMYAAVGLGAALPPCADRKRSWFLIFCVFFWRGGAKKVHRESTTLPQAKGVWAKVQAERNALFA